MRLNDIPTPALVVDLPAMERNIKRALCHPEPRGAGLSTASARVSATGEGWRAKDLFSPNLVFLPLSGRGARGVG